MRAIKLKVCYYSKRLRTSDNLIFIVDLLNSRSKIIWIIIHITYVYYLYFFISYHTLNHI